MRGAHALLCSVPLVLLAMLAQAQTSGAGDPASDAPQDIVRGTSPERREGGEASPDRFEPTERISEDLSVPFPVDI